MASTFAAFVNSQSPTDFLMAMIAKRVRGKVLDVFPSPGYELMHEDGFPAGVHWRYKLDDFFRFNALQHLIATSHESFVVKIR